MKRIVLSPQMVAALEGLSLVEYRRQPDGVRLTTLEGLRHSRLVSRSRRWRVLRNGRREAVYRWRLSPKGCDALMSAPRRATS